MRGTVVKSTGSWYRVVTPQHTVFECRIKGKMRLDDSKSTNPVAVGDIVEFAQEYEFKGIISEILERKNYIIRKASNLSKQSHIIAANVDSAYLVVTLHSPKTLLSFIDRFLVSAQAYDIPCTIVVNKCDLHSPDSDSDLLQEWKAIYDLAGYEILEVSAQTGYNIEVLRAHMKGKVCVFAGNSGVGKSSLLQALDATVSVKIKEISKSHSKGQHTTTFAEMFELDFGSYIIDTPGVKAFGLLDVTKEELAHYFPEIFRFSADCQFNNCTHIHEPNCNVVHALEQGNIALSRYENYVSLFFDENTKHRK